MSFIPLLSPPLSPSSFPSLSLLSPSSSRYRLIRLSSPNLNYLIGSGAILLYLAIIVTVLPADTAVFSSVVCNLRVWLTGFGYSLCYGTILVKMWRVYYIFSNPSTLKKAVSSPILMLKWVRPFVSRKTVLSTLKRGHLTIMNTSFINSLLSSSHAWNMDTSLTLTVLTPLEPLGPWLARG